MTTGIEWTERTWNPTAGCSEASSGCANCYARDMAWRLAHTMDSRAAYGPVVRKGPGSRPRWTGQVRMLPDRLTAPLHWRKPCRVFVNSMSDLFHPEVPDDYLSKVFCVMAMCPQHTFQVLTKWGADGDNPRITRYMKKLVNGEADIGIALANMGLDSVARRLVIAAAFGVYPGSGHGKPPYRPFPNVWLGVSAEDQAAWNRRVPALAATPAAVRFVSAEPLLGPIDMFAGIEADYDELYRQTDEERWECESCGGAGYVDEQEYECDYINFAPRLVACPDCEKNESLSELAAKIWTFRRDRSVDWVIVGGESGPHARPCRLEWIRGVVRQCALLGIPCFVKQLGSFVVHDDGARMALQSKKGSDPLEWPDDLRVREWPAREWGGSRGRDSSLRRRSAQNDAGEGMTGRE